MALTFPQWHWWQVDRRLDRVRVETNLLKFLSNLPRPKLVINRR